MHILLIKIVGKWWLVIQDLEIFYQIMPPEFYLINQWIVMEKSPLKEPLTKT